MFYIAEEEKGFVSRYLLNFETNEKVPYSFSESFSYFLTDSLVFGSRSGRDSYIIDIETGIKYPIQSALDLEPSIYVNGNVDVVLLSERLAKANRVFLINDPFQTVVVLPLDFRDDPEERFTFNFDLALYDFESMSGFLQKQNIAFQEIPSRYLGDTLSPNGKFIVRTDEIYLVSSDQKIAEIKSFPTTGWESSIMGWVYDSSAVIYSYHYDPCVFNVWGFDGTICVLRVPQPLLMLKIPEEYLSP